ncbi:unnamed protein product [Parajaminaea phylloscopi]
MLVGAGLPGACVASLASASTPPAASSRSTRCAAAAAAAASSQPSPTHNPARFRDTWDTSSGTAHQHRLLSPHTSAAMSRPLNDDEVLSEMKKMVAFIKQEAMEKAREIQVKADEEFAIEKSKIVRQEAINIDNTYEKKIKQTKVANKIAESNATNKSRLEVLQARESHLQDLFEAARSKLASLSEDKQKYGPLLTQLILQGLLQLLEPKVEVTGRDKDKDQLKKSADEAKKLYKEKSGRDVEITTKAGLSKESSGGVKLAGHGGKIRIDNTLDERLRLLEELMLPEIRLSLFGPNPNRKFSN